MMRELFFTALLVCSALADDTGYSSSYSDYHSPHSDYHSPLSSVHSLQPSYQAPNYAYGPGNNFYAAPADPSFPSLDWGLEWRTMVSAGLGFLLVLLLVGGAFMVSESIANYYYDFDSDLVFRALDGLPVPEVSQVVTAIERMQELYGEMTKTAA